MRKAGLDIIVRELLQYGFISEAKASVALDGDTQSVFPNNAFAVVLMPDDEVRLIPVADESMPYPRTGRGLR